MRISIASDESSGLCELNPCTGPLSYLLRLLGSSAPMVWPSRRYSMWNFFQFEGCRVFGYDPGVTLDQLKDTFDADRGETTAQNPGWFCSQWLYKYVVEWLYQYVVEWQTSS